MTPSHSRVQTHCITWGREGTPWSATPRGVETRAPGKGGGVTARAPRRRVTPPACNFHRPLTRPYVSSPSADGGCLRAVTTPPPPHNAIWPRPALGRLVPGAGAGLPSRRDAGAPANSRPARASHRAPHRAETTRVCSKHEVPHLPRPVAIPAPTHHPTRAATGPPRLLRLAHDERGRVCVRPTAGWQTQATAAGVAPPQDPMAVWAGEFVRAAALPRPHPPPSHKLQGIAAPSVPPATPSSLPCWSRRSPACE